MRWSMSEKKDQKSALEPLKSPLPYASLRAAADHADGKISVILPLSFGRVACSSDDEDFEGLNGIVEDMILGDEIGACLGDIAYSVVGLLPEGEETMLLVQVTACVENLPDAEPTEAAIKVLDRVRALKKQFDEDDMEVPAGTLGTVTRVLKNRGAAPTYCVRFDNDVPCLLPKGAVGTVAALIGFAGGRPMYSIVFDQGVFATEPVDSGRLAPSDVSPKPPDPDRPLLEWLDRGTYSEAMLGTKDDGVFFTLTEHPTCYRRGRYRLLIEVTHNHETHELWGCFDAADQPMRNYHNKECATTGAASIAKVLMNDRLKAAEFPLVKER